MNRTTKSELQRTCEKIAAGLSHEDLVTWAVDADIQDPAAVRLIQEVGAREGR